MVPWVHTLRISRMIMAILVFKENVASSLSSEHDAGDNDNDDDVWNVIFIQQSP